jgi:hypothetical protein
MNTDTKELAAGLRELADLMLKGSGNALMHSAADRLEELEEQLAANHEAIKLMGKWLEDERELADRLAGVLLSYHHDLLASEDMQWLPEHDKSLAAWKEARNDT